MSRATLNALQRLKTADWAATNSTESWSLEWDYDQYGNMEAQNVVVAQSEAGRMPTPGMIATYDARSNRIATGTYDDAGNLTAKGGVAYEYDAAGRMITRTENSLPVSFYYDPLGMRYGSSDTATSIVRLGATPIFEDDPAPGGQGDVEHYYALGQLIATCGADAGGSFTDCTFYHPDHLSNRMFSDGNGSIAAYQSHYPYGEAWELGPLSRFAFTSYERDWDTGEDYAMYRTYASDAKRFTSVDPVAGSGGAPQTLNRFAYVGGDPINFSDPLGLQRAWKEPAKVNEYAFSPGGLGSTDLGWHLLVTPYWYWGPDVRGEAVQLCQREPVLGTRVVAGPDGSLGVETGFSGGGWSCVTVPAGGPNSGGGASSNGVASYWAGFEKKFNVKCRRVKSEGEISDPLMQQVGSEARELATSAQLAFGMLGGSVGVEHVRVYTRREYNGYFSQVGSADHLMLEGEERSTKAQLGYTHVWHNHFNGYPSPSEADLRLSQSAQVNIVTAQGGAVFRGGSLAECWRWQ